MAENQPSPYSAGEVPLPSPLELRQGAAYAIGTLVTSASDQLTIIEHAALARKAFGYMPPAESFTSLLSAVRQTPTCHAPYLGETVIAGTLSDSNRDTYHTWLGRSFIARWPGPDDGAIVGWSTATNAMRYAHGAGKDDAYRLTDLDKFRDFLVTPRSLHLGLLASGDVVNLHRFSTGEGIGRKTALARRVEIATRIIESLRSAEMQDIDPKVFISEINASMNANHIVPVLNAAINVGAHFRGMTRSD